MLDPVKKAKWVLQSKAVGVIPALELGAIADSESIKYMCKSYSDNWDGALVFKGVQRAILVNKRIDNSGRHHFTFAHELGHYFLDHKPNYSQDGQLSIRCTISETETEQKGRETEANRFAVELLMPEERFRLDMIGALIDFGLITGLSNLYMVSKHACCNRILELTQSPCVVIRTKGHQIIGWNASRSAKGFFKSMRATPEGTASYSAIAKRWGNEDFIECEAEKWLMRSVATSKIYECTHVHVESGTAMTILKW